MCSNHANIIIFRSSRILGVVGVSASVRFRKEVAGSTNERASLLHLLWLLWTHFLADFLVFENACHVKGFKLLLSFLSVGFGYFELSGFFFDEL